jgi:hypothetical protein
MGGNIMKAVINSKILVETAINRIRRNDFYHNDYQEALEVLANSLTKEADLTDAGSWAIFSGLVNNLVQRANVAEMIKSYPQIQEIPIKNPIFITELPRRGTTLLHNLLAQDSAHRTFKLWELLSPFIANNINNNWEEKQINWIELWLNDFYQKHDNFASIHSMKAMSPHECTWLFRNSFATNDFCCNYYIPSYHTWLAKQNMISSYNFYKLQLQLLLWRKPGNILVLKAPTHIRNLNALFTIFPDAKVICLHREPTECVPSFCSMINKRHKVYCKQKSPKLIGKYCLDMLQTSLESMIEFRSKNNNNCKFIDINYDKLVHNSITTINHLYEQLKLNFDKQTETAMDKWLCDNPKDKYGKHSYNLEEFGLTQSQLPKNVLIK